MRVITNTNIIVDDFDFCKEFKKNTFIHFLTHFHFDHYEGLTTRWDYGEIFCTETSKNLILNSFPKVPRITVLHYNRVYYLNLISQKLLDSED